MISAYNAYLIDPEIHRLDLEADRALHRADVAGLTSLFCLLSPITSATTTAQTGGSHFASLLGTIVGLNAAIQADEHMRVADELMEERASHLLAQGNTFQPAF